MRKSIEQYVLALRQISEVLQSRDLAVKDTTLVSILLLDLFEKLTRTYRSAKLWTEHMRGAIELAKLRGTIQFQSALGIRLFLQLNSTILIGCMQHNVQVPIDLVALRLEASNYIDTLDPKRQFSEIVVQYGDFRAAIRESRLSSKELVDNARSLDSELKTISENVPREWTFDTIPFGIPCKEVYEDYFHVYANHHKTHTWNNIRIIRILLNELICENFLLRKDSEVGREFKDHVPQISEVIRSLSNDILASVPQYTQLLRHASQSSLRGRSKGVVCPESSKLSRSNQQLVDVRPRDYTPFEKSRCYSLIFPLYVAGSSEACLDSVRKWILTTLEFIETVVGIKEATLVAGYLKRGEKINPWSLYAMIGSYSFAA